MLFVTVAGLQVKVKDEETHQSFEYKWASIQQTPHSFDWTPVIQHDAKFDHVRCHDLQPDDLPFFLANLDSNPGTKALILINTENSFVIHSSMLAEDQASTFPVLIITQKSGNILTHLLKEYEPGTVKVKVECVPASTQGIESASAGTEKASKLPNENIKSQIVPEMKPCKKPEQPEVTKKKSSTQQKDLSKCIKIVGGELE